MSPHNVRLAAWMLLLALTAVVRLADLETRAMSHDEAVHASLTHQFVERLDYTQDPTYHGPLLYHLTGLSFFVFGDSDATARLPVALVSIAAVLLFGLFRRTLGEGGALGAALLYSISPILLFYSRYLRNDLFVVAATLIWVAMLFRYLESRRPRWLFWMVAAMTFSFAAKENSFITGAIFGLYTLSRWVSNPERDSGPGREAARAHRLAAADLSMLMLTLVLPYASGVLLFATGAPALWDGSTSMLLRSLAVAGLCAAASMALAGWWFARHSGRATDGGPGFATWSRLAGLFWAPQLILFTGLFSAPSSGFVNGVGGSLAYWLEQHGVERGGQPLFYYGLLLALYEFLPALLALGGLLLLLRRRRLDWSPTPFGVPSPASDGLQVGDGLATTKPRASARHRRAFLEFLVWWAIASFCGYSLAGERMPWLATHVALPLVLLGGWFGAVLCERCLHDLRGGDGRGARWAVAAGGMLGVVLLLAIARLAPPALVQPPRALLLLLAVVLAFATLRARPTHSRGAAARGLAMGLTLFLLLLTLRASWQASFVRQDQASELLVYAHSSADMKRLLARLDRLEEEKGAPLGIRYTADVAWPSAWYLRSRPNASVLAEDEPDLAEADVVLTGDAPPDDVWAHVARGWAESRAVRTWWPVDTYRSWNVGDLLERASDPISWRRALEIFLFRRYPGVSATAWPNREDFHVYVRRPDMATDLPPIEIRTAQVHLTFEGPWETIELSRPADVAAMPDGGWLVADPGAGRVLWIDGDGALVHQWTEVAGERLREPWGVAVSPDGRIAIADTWNHRVMWTTEPVLADTNPTWSSWRPTEAPPLYGPRDVAFSEDGHLWLTDTGNGRALRLTFDEALDVAEVSTAGENLAEPVGLAVLDGGVLVAESWAHRLTRLDDTPSSNRGLELPAWRSRDAKDKPYLGTLPGGGMLTTDPSGGRVLRLEVGGSGLELTEAIRIVFDGSDESDDEASVPFRPIGVAARQLWDPQRGWEVAVADAEGGRIVVIRLPGEGD